MNETSKKVEAVLSETEEELKKLIGEAGLAGDYEAVDLSRAAASHVRELRGRLCHGGDVEQGVTGREPVRASTTTPSPTRTRRTKKTSRGKAAEYPKFFTRNGMLCKVGWSKKTKREYVHKVPKDAFDRTVAAIRSIAASASHIFTAEQIVEQLDRNGGEVPGYQVYVILALLREKGVLHRQGREGYTGGDDSSAAAAAAWASLGDRV